MMTQPNKRDRPREPFGATLTLICLIAASWGCAADQPLDPAIVDAYRAGRYRDSLAAARQAAPNLSGAGHEQAVYMVGMSAYQLGDAVAATNELTKVQDSNDAAIRGHANATLGLIYLRRDSLPTAKRHLERAVSALEGEDKAQAHYYIGTIEQKQGYWPSARTHFTMARGLSSDAKFRQTVTEMMSATGFTLQLGAFGNRQNADRLAQSMVDTAKKLRLLSPRIITTSEPDGRTLFRVQLGEFSTWDSALRARQQLNRSDAIIALLSHG